MKALRLLHKTIGAGLNMTALIAPDFAARRALSLFATPPKPRIRPKEAAFLAEAQQDEWMLAQQPIRVYQWGPASGPLAVLSYGWAYNAGRWRHFVPTLVAAGFRVVAYDPPGHGYSARGEVAMPLNAAIIQELIQKLGRPEVLIGHSFGGASSVYALSRLPAELRPRRIVLMAAFSRPNPIFRQFKRRLGLHDLAYWRFIRYIEGQIGTDLRSMDLAWLSGQFEEVRALIVHDRHDEMTAFAHACRYHAYWPHSALLASEHKGHHLGHPDITTAILDFACLGRVPEAALLQQHALPVEHDLVRYFAGIE